MTFADRLQQATLTSSVCVGLDPVPEKLPLPLRERSDGMLRFIEGIIQACSPYAAAFKPNFAFFETLDQGESLLKATVEIAKSIAPHAVLIADAKRGDIGSTAQKYASALFERWGFDAATVNPLFGTDGIEPFTQYADKGIFLLAMTSNPSAVQLQDHGGEDDPLYLKSAVFAERVWNSNGNVGLVAGATRPERLVMIRKAAPSLPLLIPGIGAQGGDLEGTVRAAFTGPPNIINSSRQILYASSGEDWMERAAEQAEDLRDRINKLQGR